jgi:hypothetical protein
MLRPNGNEPTCAHLKRVARCPAVARKPPSTLAYLIFTGPRTERVVAPQRVPV